MNIQQILNKLELNLDLVCSLIGYVLNAKDLRLLSVRVKVDWEDNRPVRRAKFIVTFGWPKM